MALIRALSARTSGEFIARLWVSLCENVQKQCCATLTHEQGTEEAPEALPLAVPERVAAC